MKINWVDVIITNRCNLSCSYCFHKKSNTDLSMNVLNKLSMFLKDKSSDGIVFNLFGGEPLLRTDLCLTVMSTLRKEFPHCIFCISTNAVVYSDVFVKYFTKDNNCNKIQISHDGVDQDLFRGMSGIINENVKKYVESVDRNCLDFRLTFTRNNVFNLFDNISFLYDLGARSITHQADFSDKWSADDVEIYKQQIDKLYELIDEKADLNIKYCGYSSLSGKDSSICMAGRHVIAVDTDGSIFPCHRFIGKNQFRIGSVIDGSFNRGRFSSLWNRNCEYCDAKSTCHQCIAANYEVTGSMLEPIDAICEMNKYEHSKYKKLEIEENDFINNIVLLLNKIVETNEEKARLINERFASKSSGL